MINLNGCWVSEDDAEFISDHKGEMIYSVDERDELFTDLDEAKEYAETLLDDWVGDLNITEYRANLRFDEEEGEFTLDNPLQDPLIDTGRYWTRRADGWREMPEEDANA